MSKTYTDKYGTWTITNAGTIELVSGNYKIDNLSIPSPTTIDCEYHILDRAFNCYNGITRIYPYRIKKAVTWHYKNVSADTYNIINNYSLNKIENQGTREVTVTTEFYGKTNAIELTGHIGSPISIVTVFSSKDKKIVNFDIHVVEDIGIAIKTKK